MASQKTTDPAATVAYPRAKRPANPVKILTKETVLKLQAADIPISQLQQGYPSIYSLAKHSPKLLQRVVSTVRRSSGYKKGLWRYILSYRAVASDSESAERMFRDYFLMVTMAAEKYKDRGPMSALNETGDAVREIRALRPDIGNEKLLAIFRASYVHASIGKPRSTSVRTYLSSKYDRKSKRFTAENIDDIEYIAEHYEAVQRILPELKKRRVNDRDMISTILESDTPALIDGIL